MTAFLRRVMESQAVLLGWLASILMMEGQREVVAAIIVTLSKVHQLTKAGSGISEETLANLKDLERALGILLTLCGDQEPELAHWKSKIEALRRDATIASQEIRGRIREYQSLLEREVMSLLNERLPEGEFRERVEAELQRILGSDLPAPVESSRKAFGEEEAMSRLELKLERIKSEMEGKGLERYLQKGTHDPPSSEG